MLCVVTMAWFIKSQHFLMFWMSVINFWEKIHQNLLLWIFKMNMKNQKMSLCLLKTSFTNCILINQIEKNFGLSRILCPLLKRLEEKYLCLQISQEILRHLVEKGNSLKNKISGSVLKVLSYGIFKIILFNLLITRTQAISL